MEKVVIQATRRTVIGKQVGALRRQGKLPGVLYGTHIDPTPITMDLRDASRSLHGLTSSTLVTINLDGKDHATLVREKQRNFITGTLLHVDFQAVSLTEKIRAKVSIDLTGLSPAVKDYNGYVVIGLDKLEVEAFPQDLPERITIDMGKLAKIGDGLYVRDLNLGDKVVILSAPDDILAVVTTTSEEAPEVPVAVDEPEIIEKGKKEEEEEAKK